MKRNIFLDPLTETQGNGKPDQTDIVSQNAKLVTDLAAANATIATVTGERDTARTELATVKTNLSTVTGERDTARTELATVKTERDNLKTENTTLKADKSTVESAAAKIVAAVGIVTDKTKTELPGATAKEPTLTEKVLAAKGCKTLAELETKDRERLAANPGL